MRATTHEQTKISDRARGPSDGKSARPALCALYALYSPRAPPLKLYLLAWRLQKIQRIHDSNSNLNQSKLDEIEFFRS